MQMSARDMRHQTGVRFSNIQCHRLLDNPSEALELAPREAAAAILGKVARSDAASPLKRAASSPVALMLATDCFIRRVGRPRAEYSRAVRNLALRMVGRDGTLEDAVACENTWKAIIKGVYW